MEKSKYNIVSQIYNSDKYFIVNLLSGNADILTKEEFESYEKIETLNETSSSLFIEKGYLVDPMEENKLFQRKYLEFLANNDKEEIQIFFVPWYTCNFNCNYCYQSGYENEIQIPELNVIDSFFNFIKNNFADRKKYLTLFGGEPLLIGKKYYSTIEYFLEKSKENNLDVSIVTNGYYLEEYLNLLKNYSIREIQVTLDGTKLVHDRRRKLVSGDETFEKIVRGIDKSLELGLTINLRVVLDNENINNLPALAEFCSEKGWTKRNNFKTQLGRNYELHYCQSNRTNILTRFELYKQYYFLSIENPILNEFHKPSFTIVKNLYDNGELPLPLYDDCPGTKSEWAFDSYGDIYSCTATVGKADMKLGTYYPEKKLDEEKILEWQSRDIMSVVECKTCNVNLICGGGCAALAYNQNGKLNSTDCRPVKELMELGFKYYFNNEI